MKPCELQTMLSREWQQRGQYKIWHLRPEAQVVTGHPKHDAQLHRVLVEYGVEVKLDRYHCVKDYRVVDDKKFMMFVLKWA